MAAMAVKSPFSQRAWFGFVAGWGEGEGALLGAVRGDDGMAGVDQWLVMRRGMQESALAQIHTWQVTARWGWAG